MVDLDKVGLGTGGTTFFDGWGTGGRVIGFGMGVVWAAIAGAATFLRFVVRDLDFFDPVVDAAMTGSSGFDCFLTGLAALAAVFSVATRGLIKPCA